MKKAFAAGSKAQKEGSLADGFKNRMHHLTHLMTLILMFLIIVL
jgi:hypothetical protein